MATLSQLRDAVNRMIAQQGEDAPCAYWVYSKEDAYVIDEDGEYNYIYDEGELQAEAVVNALDELQEVDYVYTVIQECLDELVEEKVMLKLQEQAWEEDIKDGVPDAVNRFIAS